MKKSTCGIKYRIHGMIESNEPQKIIIFAKFDRLPSLQRWLCLLKFYYLDLLINKKMIKSPPSLQQSHKSKRVEEQIVYKLSKNTEMKFRPEKATQDSGRSSLISKFKSLSKFFSKQDTKKIQIDELKKSNGFQTTRNSILSSEGLKFLFRLDNEAFLIGNHNQLDAINLTIVEDYIESQQLWALRPKSTIKNLLVDDRRKCIVVILTGQIVIYSYEGRRSKNPPKLQKSIRVIDEIKMMQMAKDSLLTVFYEDSVHSYLIDGVNSRQYSKKQYKVQKTLKLYQLAQCIENVLNVFFWCPSSSNQKVFQLWCMPIEILTDKLVFGQTKKIYDIEYTYKDSLKIESITKDSYFMNMGQYILMFRKGYCVDKVSINLEVKGTLLKYFGDKKLIHISPSQIDLYNVNIDLVSNPPKLTVQSFDSITNTPNKKHVFLNAIKFQEHKIAFFYQMSSPNGSGQVKYYFTLTQKWNLQEKINSILPRISQYGGKYEGEQYANLLNQIEASCDAVGKMGVTRKDAYLRIWKQSNKEKVEQFKFLLDTHDYNTIREEILLKLRKKSMIFNEVQKIQSACLSMIGEKIFNSKGFTLDQIKNYLISHFLIRKLELFKEIKLYEKRVGKIKLAESETNEKSKDKLMINIQQYTNSVKMDIKGYFLEMIYNFAKYKKDLATEIRIVLRKFKFAFIFIYQTLLKEIVNTVKEDLLYLLKNIPELLPYEQKIQIPDQEEASLLKGLWGNISDEEWDSALYLDNVITIYNKQLIEQLKNSVWTKRFWLTNHDMIFLNKASIQQEWNKVNGQYLFYNLVQHIYENYANKQKAMEIIHYIEETYINFPPHLFNTIPLYRELFLYFQRNQVMNEPFKIFLRKTDQQIFKKVFDHQKFKKGSFLRDIKPIFQNLKQSDKFNIGLLKYFSSNLSEVSDIKYLLNRINNQKKQFHDQNIQMYEVLVKGMQIKLKLGSEKDIPISQVLIYIENIPLTQKSPVSKELQVIQKINQEGEKFKKMKLNMSVFQMVRNRDSVLIFCIGYEIETAGLRTNHEQSFVITKSKQIIDDLIKVREKIYGPFQDNVILFIYLIKLLQTKQLIHFASQIIRSNSNQNCPFDNGHLESVVFYCYRQQMVKQPTYAKSQPYIEQLISILPQENNLKMFIKSELELASIFSQGGKQIKFPICGESGLITKMQLQGMIETLSKEELLSLNIERIYQLSSTLQKIVGSSFINLYELYETYFSFLVKKGALQRAIDTIKKIIQLEPDNINNIIYPIIIFKGISNQLIEENKTHMINLMGSLFKKPEQLLKIYQYLMSKSFSNQQQKSYLTQALGLHSIPPSERLKVDNILFNDEFLEYLQINPDKTQKCAELFHNQFYHLIHSNDDFLKSVDVLIYHLLIVHQPILLIKYVQFNKYTLNIKQVRSFMSYLCKYEAYDPIKVLQFSKRMFKVLYDIQKKQGNFKELVQGVINSPLLETTSIDLLDSSTDNLSKLVKSIEKFKAKLKYKLNSSSAVRKRNSSGSVQLLPKFKRIEEYMEDPQKYFEKNDYPFNDSDGYVEKKQSLVAQKFKQGSDNNQFCYKRYLTWLFNRKNQQIEYYLLKANEAEADEALHKQQEALKLSFKKSPNDKQFKDHANVVGKAFQKITDQRQDDALGFLTISAIPNVPQSAISLKQILTEEIQEVYLGSTLLKQQIVSTLKLEEDRVTFDTKVFQKFGTTQKIQEVLPDLIKDIYNDPAVDYGTGTAIIRQIYNIYLKLTPVNINFLEIYSKVEQIQKKLGLNLQTRELLPYQGLLIKDKDSTALFSFIKPFVIPHLNQNNIHTLSRILSLSFKKPEIQQEIVNQYFNIIVKEYKQLENQFDENMKLEKIAAFAQKMPLSHLKLQIQKLIEVITNPRKQKRIMKVIIDILRLRHDASSAKMLQERWMNDKPESLEVSQ